MKEFEVGDRVIYNTNPFDDEPDNYINVIVGRIFEGNGNGWEGTYYELYDPITNKRVSILSQESLWEDQKNYSKKIGRDLHS